MLEKPTISDEWILAQVQEAYKVRPLALSFLPIGADANTAVYRLKAQDGKNYFIKLRIGDFNAISALLPQYLQQSGIRPILSPLQTVDGQAWTQRGETTLLLYPFVDGQDGYQIHLSDRQWVKFGAALQAVHAIRLPPALQDCIPRETYAPRWRQTVKDYQKIVAGIRWENEEKWEAEKRRIRGSELLNSSSEEGLKTFRQDRIAADLASFMRGYQEEITFILRRAEQLAEQLMEQSPPFALCHTDLHPGNLLIEGPTSFYIVDWDAPLFAPKERDLMFIGGMVLWQDARLRDLFYRGYGPAQVNRTALAYYRYERIVEDLAVECELIFSSDRGDEDRKQELGYFKSNFLPDHEIELAKRTEE